MENNTQPMELSSIVNLILQNPALIEEISKLANGNREESAKSEQTVSEAPADTLTIDTQQSNESSAEAASASVSGSIGRGVNRRQLFAALRPYLSEGRARTLDSMEAIAAVLETVKR